jgi:hypothetical protein
MHATAGPIATASLALAASSAIAVTPAIVPLPDVHRVLSAAVRLVDNPLDILGDPTNLGGLTSDLGSLGSLFDLGGLTNLGGLGTDISSLFGGSGSSLLNIPYNIFADIVNIPYYESLALEEYAYALGPAGATGGVPGWIPPGTPTDAISALDQYMLGGTGSWYGESIGNTWGWDDGNWPQLDALLHFILPFSFTESLADQVQTFAQAELIDGAQLGCEFECANPLGYLGGWLHGETPLASLLNGTTFPTILEDTVGKDVGSVINIGDPATPVNVPTVDGMTPGTGVIWSGQDAQLNLLDPLQAIAGNLTASPSLHPIEFPNIGDVFTNGVKLAQDVSNDFNPFQTGSFLFWGAPTDYSVPAALAGILEEFTGIPNQFGFPADQVLGAEPVSGYSATPSDLPGYFAQGIQYFLNGNGGTAGNGLLGYLNPEIYLQALNNDIALLTNPNDLLAALPLVGYLGLGDNVAGAISPGSLFATFAPGTLTGPFDATGLFSGFDASTLLDSLNPASLLGGALDPSTLTTDLSGLLPGVGTDLASLLGTNLATDLSSGLGTSAVQLVPDLALQLLSAI